jgi:hypothetical protein
MKITIPRHEDCITFQQPFTLRVSPVAVGIGVNTRCTTAEEYPIRLIRRDGWAGLQQRIQLHDKQVS